MKTFKHYTWTTLLTLATCSEVPRASANPSRSLIIRTAQRESETHINIRASALETDSSGVFPISTLDKNSFQLMIDGQKISGSGIGLSTFDTSRRWNNRAVVWVYDANGVKTMKGLNKELRALSAQEFTSFNADFMSILGVAQNKTIERILLDPQHQDNTLALQRQLLGDPVGISPDSVYKDSAICVSARKFEKWTASGLKNSDQKLLILIGGSQPSVEQERAKTDACLSRLVEMQVIVHQIIFAKPDTFVSRHWTLQPDVIKNGAVYRVVDTQGASRAIQSSRNILDKEYLLSAQLPLKNQSNPKSSESSLRLVANYHGSEFQSDVYPIVLGNQSTTPVQDTPRPLKQKPSTPPRMALLDNKASLAINAWIEWLATSVLIGIVVTIRHMKRMQTGVFSLEDAAESVDTSHGPLLLVLNGKDKGREFLIRQKKVVFGRGLSCDLRLTGRRIKRKHGCLSFQADKALLEDFSNGDLAVNGRPLRHLRVIGHGSVIQLGELQLLFRCGES